MRFIICYCSIILLLIKMGRLVPVENINPMSGEDIFSCEVSVLEREACRNGAGINVTDKKECALMKGCCYRNDSHVPNALKCFKKGTSFSLKFKPAIATKHLMNSRQSIRSISYEQRTRSRLLKRACSASTELCGLPGTLQRDCERLFCCWDEVKQECFRRPIYHRPRIPKPDEFYLSFLEAQSKVSKKDDRGCPSNGIMVSRYCFFPLVKNLLSFKDSERACHTFGGKLARITSREMYEVVSAHVRNHLTENYENNWPLFLHQTFLWIGSLYKNDNDVIMITNNDIIRNASSSWVTWYPGSPVNNSMFNRLSWTLTSDVSNIQQGFVNANPMLFHFQLCQKSIN